MKTINTDDCWLYARYINPDGYGVVCHKLGNRYVLTKIHRATYITVKGEIPEGLELDHLCRVRACINPEHLEAVTHRENVIRGISPHAFNARKTHCKNGHEFTEDNLCWSIPGTRHCRTCQNKRNSDYQKRVYASKSPQPVTR